ncbi:MAG: hypothetical protein A2V67_02535 [Deltaproteobacteria bacterium RBG_13_61_14]|nr:MAG: hypothetical protein A2V67_02535 [Deltaproteobacteria bacterium RBG_13_61_14]
MAPQHQILPRSGPEREALRKKGQFWTPEWVAKAMVAYVLKDGADTIFDPAVGTGVFFLTAKKLAEQMGRKIHLAGCELDPETLKHGKETGLEEADLQEVRIEDFLFTLSLPQASAIIANPPYIRHHRLAADYKLQLQKLAMRLMGFTLDGRAGLHIYFLLRALDLLTPDGRLAFIMPADTCEGVSAPRLWDWITRRFRLEAVVTFAPEASPFPGVDTNPVIFMIRKANPAPDFFWLRLMQPEAAALSEWIMRPFAEVQSDSLVCVKRDLKEGLAAGLSRFPVDIQPEVPVLGQFASVLRGIATGANDFFFLSRRQALELELPDEFLIPTIGRNRDVKSDRITAETMLELEKSGKPTLLFAPDDRPWDLFPPSVRRYLEKGAEGGLPHRPLLATRNPWYKMEFRKAPPLLFAYLGRRNARFIRNLAGVVPLTCLLCVYPKSEEKDYIERLWKILQHPETIQNLFRVGKSYGSGCIKVEPRALEKLPLPTHLLQDSKLESVATSPQLNLFGKNN